MLHHKTMCDFSEEQLAEFGCMRFQYIVRDLYNRLGSPVSDECTTDLIERALRHIHGIYSIYHPDRIEYAYACMTLSTLLFELIASPGEINVRTHLEEAYRNWI